MNSTASISGDTFRYSIIEITVNSLDMKGLLKIPLSIFRAFYVLLCSLFFLCSCKPVNAVYDSHFTDDGQLRVDSSKVEFHSEYPNGIAFLLETSGSMNGYLRANKPTEFKRDVWAVVSNFGNPGVFVFADGGNDIRHIDGPTFQNRMNSGAFVSHSSTLVPSMMSTILDQIDFSKGNVAVLISDMKYSPVGKKAMAALLMEYSTDILNIAAKHNELAYCLIGAYSNYFSSHGEVEKSPYYYLLIGVDKYLPEIRNSIITLIGSSFIEDVEVGFNYMTPKYSFGVPENAIQLVLNVNEPQPCFVGAIDTCKIVLNLDISDCRSKIANEDVLRDCFSVKSTYGSSVKIVGISVSDDRHFKKSFKRKAVASVEILVYDMFTDADVLEWSLSYPDKVFNEDFVRIISVQNENDLSGSFSLNSFIKGLFAAEQNHWDETPNYILVSKNQ